MIRINLAKQKKATSTPRTLADIKDFIKGSPVSTKINFNSPVVKLAAALILYTVANFLIEQTKQELFKVVDGHMNTVNSEKQKVDAQLQKIAGFEPVKKQLDEDEKTVRTKLEVVNTLLGNRGTPSQMLVYIAKVMPAEMWLTELKVTEELAKLVGGTTSYNQISDFIKALSGTREFGEIVLSEVHESVGVKDQKHQLFELSAKRKQGQINGSN